MESQIDDVGGVLLRALCVAVAADLMPTGVAAREPPYAVLARESGRGGEKVGLRAVSDKAGEAKLVEAGEAERGVA